jgi:lipopolysaccharide cholinephosphotransferase
MLSNKYRKGIMRELTIKETQQVSLEILYTITQICEKQGLRYSLIYGTLIGAIRHQDYIPWDDDVDIMMPRPDYEKLLKYLEKHIKDYPYLRVFNCDKCKKYPYMITRISDDRYIIKMENEKPYGMGIFIDIYPYDGLGMTKKEAVKYGMKGDRLSSMCYQATRDHFAIETTTSIIRKIIKFPIYAIAKLIGKNYFQKKLQRLAGLKAYDKSKYIGCVVWLSGGEKDIFLRKWFDETIFKPFGKYEFRVPKEYDKVLRHTYGDYMKLPPKEERIGHHYYKVYQK